MNRTLQLRRETLTELSPDELSTVVAGIPTSPWRVCLYDLAYAVLVASDMSFCCSVEPDAGERP